MIGKYIVDFYCAKAKLVIELDGSQHNTDCKMVSDADRTVFLEKYGLKILRIPNHEVNGNFQNVCVHIDNMVKQSLSQLR